MGSLPVSGAVDSVLRPVVAKIVDAMAGRPLAEAESTIEAARRILWMRYFIGVDGEAIAAMLNAPLSARYAAAEITTACASAPEPLLAAERVLLELRMQLYMAAYGAAPGCRAEG